MKLGKLRKKSDLTKNLQWACDLQRISRKLDKNLQQTRTKLSCPKSILFCFHWWITSPLHVNTNSCSLCPGRTEPVSELPAVTCIILIHVCGCFQPTHASSDDTSTRKYSYCTPVVTSFVVLQLCNCLTILVIVFERLIAVVVDGASHQTVDITSGGFELAELDTLRCEWIIHGCVLQVTDWGPCHTVLHVTDLFPCHMACHFRPTVLIVMLSAKSMAWVVGRPAMPYLCLMSAVSPPCQPTFI